MCVCVCVRERERERKRVYIYIYIYILAFQPCKGVNLGPEVLRRAGAVKIIEQLGK